MAYVVDLILETEVGRGLVCFFPFPHGLDGARCCIVTTVDFRVSPLSCARISVCGEVSNLLLRGCKKTDKCEEKLFGIYWSRGLTFSKTELIPGEFACIPCSARFIPASF